MGFFDDIGRAFQDAGNAINNEVIQPAQITLDPAKNGVADSFDPTKNGFINEVSKIQDVPKIIEDLPNKIETQINVELKKINPRLKLPPKPKIPPPRILKPDEINKIIKNGFDDTILKPVVSGFEKDIINPSKTIADNIKTGFQKDIIDGFKKDVIGGFQKDIIDGFQKDIINPSQSIFNNIGDTLNSLGGGQVPTNTSSSDNMSMYIIIGAVLVGMYFFIPNKKTVNNKI
jgi:hypothetical protein